jgi:DNA-binding transcriptional LysR family regulator
MMELRHLRSFVTLAHELNFSRAAERLNIVQPALSGQIKSLEVELGVQLFVRDRRSVSLTEVGRVFLPQAKATLDQADAALRVARHAEQGDIGELRISFVSSVIPEILPNVIRRLRAQYPRLQLHFHDMSTPRQIDALNDGRVDFGFLRLPVNAHGLHVELILEEPFVVVLPGDHPLAAQQAIAADSLQNEPMLSLARGAAPGYSDALLGALTAEGLVLNIVQEFTELTTMVSLVASHLGLAIVPSSVAISLPPGTVARALRSMSHRSQLGIAWKGTLNKVGKSFREFCHKGTSRRRTGSSSTEIKT